jgi:hypothetical protein
MFDPGPVRTAWEKWLDSNNVKTIPAHGMVDFSLYHNKADGAVSALGFSFYGNRGEATTIRQQEISGLLSGFYYTRPLWAKTGAHGIELNRL